MDNAEKAALGKELFEEHQSIMKSRDYKAELKERMSTPSGAMNVIIRAAKNARGDLEASRTDGEYNRSVEGALRVISWIADLDLDAYPEEEACDGGKV